MTDGNAGEWKAPKGTRIGHTHLTVSDLDRSLGFYRDLLGFQVMQRFGDSAAFISDGEYHHHIGLNTWAGSGATPAPKGHTGLYHHAILYPDRKSLATVLKRLVDANYPFTGFSDHGVSEAIYLDDPDGIGVELYTDRPMELWDRNPDGSLAMKTDPLDIDSLLAELTD